DEDAGVERQRHLEGGPQIDAPQDHRAALGPALDGLDVGVVPQPVTERRGHLPALDAHVASWPLVSRPASASASSAASRTVSRTGATADTCSPAPTRAIRPPVASRPSEARPPASIRTMLPAAEHT